MKYDSYLQIDPDFYDIIQAHFVKSERFKVFFFAPDMEIQESKGKFIKILADEGGEYLIIENAKAVRLDRIITINGRPGPAFDEYDAYANACLSCRAGYKD